MAFLTAEEVGFLLARSRAKKMNALLLRFGFLSSLDLRLPALPAVPVQYLHSGLSKWVFKNLGFRVFLKPKVSKSPNFRFLKT